MTKNKIHVFIQATKLTASKKNRKELHFTQKDDRKVQNYWFRGFCIQ